jgi:bifunctional DNase/RNase
LDEVAGDRHVPILIGLPEAFSLSARLGGIMLRPMTYQLTAALVQAFGGRIREVRIDRLVERETYGATIEVEGPLGVRLVDARPSDALNLAAVADAPILAAAEVLVEAEARRAGDSVAAARLRQALVAPPMTVATALSSDPLIRTLEPAGGSPGRAPREPTAYT